MYIVHSKGCRTGSNSIYQKASELASLLKIDRPFFVLANLPIIQFPADSAIGKHLMDNQLCALDYNNDRFCVLFNGRFSFHLSALEATLIRTLQRNLCRQKKFAFSLKIFH